MSEKQMQPVIILPPDTMSKDDMERLRENGLCVVEAKEPVLVKFMDPIPAVIGRTAVEDAAIQLSRKILNPGYWTTPHIRQALAESYIDILMKGTKLDPEPSQQEKERAVFSAAKREELQRLAQEEARQERAAVRAAKAASKK